MEHKILFTDLDETLLNRDKSISRENRDAIAKMLDTSCGEDYEKALTAYIAAQEDVVQVDMLHSRMFGNKTYIELELQVDGNLPLREAHAIAERIHDSVEAHFSEIKHITIHLNPSAL